MKKVVILILTCFIICTAFNNSMLNDYRYSYVGCYFCSRSSTSFNLGGPPIHSKDTVTICVSKDIPDSIMQIVVRGNTYKFKLKNGTLYASPASGRQRGKFFASDSISLYISYGHSSSSFIGKKK